MPQDRVDPPAPSLTRLAGLELKNFKSVRQTDVTIGALTVIVGANSTGKSSLLQAVLAMTQITSHRIDGHRFPLNGKFAQLGTFEAVRHQRADPMEPVRIGLRFSIDTKDMWWYSDIHYYRSKYPPGPEPQLRDVSWAIELDSATEDQLGSAQISALEVHTKIDEFVASVRLERDRTSSRPPRQHYDPAEGTAFTGFVRSADSKIPVSDAHISNGQVETLFGTPPSAQDRVRDWFSVIANQPQLEHPAEADNQGISPQQAIQQAVWAIRLEEQAEADFVEWYGRRTADDREKVQEEVLEGFKEELSMRRRSGTSDAESLEGFGPTRLNRMQRACAQYLATQVRYVGPLRRAPHRQFPSAPDPDLGEVGVEGEYCASVLQANRGTERYYPVPGGAPEQLPLLEAVKRWMVCFGLAEDLRVRQDIPLAFGIDVVPPGLERPVTLSAVGVGVSQVLPVIVQCLVAGPSALVVLEQPELHLHPAAQQRLADFFLACTAWGQNLLVESHSEYLVLRLRRRIAEDPTNRLKDDLVLLFASRDNEGETVYEPIVLTNTGALDEWPDGFFEQGSDEAHQLLIAAANKQRRAGGDSGE